MRRVATLGSVRALGLLRAFPPVGRAGTAATLLMLGIGTVAFVARLLPVLRGGGLHGVLAYDDGVYFGAAESLVFGRLPYRDFVLLHPPGIMLALSPFAGLARLTGDDDGPFALARVAFMIVGAVNAVLVLHIARRQLGTAAGVVGGLFYALWGPALYAERTTLLEPLVNLGLLSALLLLGNPPSRARRATAAGVALGLATAVKLWAVVPLVVLLGWLLLRDRRAAMRFAGGASGAATAVCLPFFLAAPDRMWRLVVIAQLGRTNNGIPPGKRLTGVTEANALARVLPWSAHQLTVAVTLVVIAAMVVLVLRRPTARPWCALLVAQTALVLQTPSYFDHYTTYVAPALALVVAATASVALAAVRSAGPALRPAVRPAALATTGAATVVLVLAGQVHAEGRPAPGSGVQAMVRTERCIAADAPETLESADLLAHDLRDGCPVLIDPTGLPYASYRAGLRPGNTVAARRGDLAWQHRIMRYFAHSEAVVLQHRNPDGLSEATLGSIAHDKVGHAGSFDVYDVR